MTTVAGLDIARGEWALVELSWNDGKDLQVSGMTVPYGQLEFRDNWALGVIDVPIGMLADDEAAVTDRGRSGDRRVDRGARRWCRSPSSVFPPPTQGQFQTGIAEHHRASAGRTRTERKRLLTKVEPGGLSKQSFELLPAIHDAAQVKSEHADKFFESHPEVVFSVMASGIVPLSKKSPAGALFRANLLADRLDQQVLRWVLQQEGATGVSADDWLDAISMAVVAYDWVNGQENRRMLTDESGHVQQWNDCHLEQMLALPDTPLLTPPDRMQTEAVIGDVLESLKSL